MDLRPQPSIQLVSLDLDDTVLGNAEATRRFREAWQSLEAESRPLLVYNTGRSAADARWLALEHAVPDPEFVIGGIGTELHDPLDRRVADIFRAEILPGWNAEIVQQIIGARPHVRAQAMEFLNPCKLSWDWIGATPAELAELEHRLRAAHVEATVIYSERRFLDVIPRRAGKGHALAWLCRRVGVPLHRVVVAGASANNESAFALPGVHRILIKNAAAVLKMNHFPATSFAADEIGADGVLAGLAHFGVIPQSAIARMLSPE